MDQNPIYEERLWLLVSVCSEDGGTLLGTISCYISSTYLGAGGPT